MAIDLFQIEVKLQASQLTYLKDLAYRVNRPLPLVAGVILGACIDAFPDFIARQFESDIAAALPPFAPVPPDFGLEVE